MIYKIIKIFLEICKPIYPANGKGVELIIQLFYKGVNRNLS